MEFLSICLWKSRRPKNLYKENSEAFIKSVTKKAFKEPDELEKVKILCNLSGVNVPTASAILSVTNPRRYPVIDIRCVESLQNLKLINWKVITPNSWVEYLKIVRGIAETQKKSTREVEKGLFAYNRLRLDEDLRNLYIIKTN